MKPTGVTSNLQRAYNYFTKHDKDGNGFISLSEFKKIPRRHKVSEERLEQVFGKHVSQGSGSSNEKGFSLGALTKSFNEMDKNDDRKITRHERKLFHQAIPKPVDESAD